MNLLTDFLSAHPGGHVDTSNISVDATTNKSFLQPESVSFLKYFLRLSQPKKVLEVGVAEGGGTIHILDELEQDAALYSVDLLTQRKNKNDEVVPIGHYASAYYNPEVHASWKTFFGVDVSEVIEEIGGGIDCIILDTSHRLPGEVLSFLSVLPFLTDNCLLLIDDISLHTRDIIFSRKDMVFNNCCNFILYSAILSKHKFLREGMFSNFGAVIIDKNICMSHIDFIMNSLFIPWSYTPDTRIIYGTYVIIKKYYPENIVDMYLRAYRNFCIGTQSYSDPVELDEKIQKLKNTDCYYFGIGEAYSFYKSMFKDMRPIAALVSMTPGLSQEGLPKEIDGIPVRMADDVLSCDTEVKPVVVFARKVHVNAMLSFLNSCHHEWSGDNVILCVL